VPADTLQQLSARGHEVSIRRQYTQEMGRGQAILHDSNTGINYAASDPRRTLLQSRNPSQRSHNSEVRENFRRLRHSEAEQACTNTMWH
jgi:hypothetical protein